MSRTLVVVTAETSAHRATFDLFKRNLLDVFQADLALCVAERPGEDRTDPFHRHARYVWTSPSFDDWGTAIEQVTPTVRPDWRKLLQVGGLWLGGVKGPGAQRGSGAIVFYFRALLKKRLVESGVLADYDRVILTRSDFLHAAPHVPPRHLDNRYIWIPDGEHHGGVCDRHMVCPASRFVRVLSLLDDVTGRPDELYRLMRHRPRWNTEQYLALHLRREGLEREVRFFPYSMFLVREEGGRECWMPGRYDPRLGLYVRYRGEYVGSRIASRVVGSRGWTGPRIRLWKLLRLGWRSQRFWPGFAPLKRRLRRKHAAPVAAGGARPAPTGG